ncbi:MAG: DUF6364 family protein [Flammeovirgaceae bacterium]|nr:DUF6364 family protein [Flammeovirgaceae bacterium]
MDAKITLSFDQGIIDRAKKFADSQNISLSRLTEMLYSKIVSGHYTNLEELPVSDWVNELAEGKAEYKTRQSSRKSLKNEFYKTRK